MTYCVAIKLNAGLVFLSDSRTNAGLDQISSFRKMMVYEKAGDRFMVLLSAGNLSISQSVREILQLQQLRDERTGEMLTIWNARSMFDAARILGAAVRHVYDRDGVALKRAGLDFNVSLVLGGQIRGEGMRLFQVYSAGNFIEATSETPYFQVGESKYGKPVLDRVLTPETPLDEAAKCALVSMDSTIKSNLSVGLPLDLIVYEADQFSSDKIVCIDETNPYYRLLHDNWGERLRHVFDSIEDPAWGGGATNAPIRVSSRRCHPLHKITPATVAAQPAPAAPAPLRPAGAYSAASALRAPAHLPIAPVHPDHLMAGEADAASAPPKAPDAQDDEDASTP
jgi:putative proteasome-type protease